MLACVSLSLCLAGPCPARCRCCCCCFFVHGPLSCWLQAWGDEPPLTRCPWLGLKEAGRFGAQTGPAVLLVYRGSDKGPSTINPRKAPWALASRALFALDAAAQTTGWVHGCGASSCSCGGRARFVIGDTAEWCALGINKSNTRENSKPSLRPASSFTCIGRHDTPGPLQLPFDRGA